MRRALSSIFCFIAVKQFLDGEILEPRNVIAKRHTVCFRQVFAVCPIGQQRFEIRVFCRRCNIPHGRITEQPLHDVVIQPVVGIHFPNVIHVLIRLPHYTQMRHIVAEMSNGICFCVEFQLLRILQILSYTFAQTAVSAEIQTFGIWFVQQRFRDRTIIGCAGDIIEKRITFHTMEPDHIPRIDIDQILHQQIHDRKIQADDRLPPVCSVDLLSANVCSNSTCSSVSVPAFFFFIWYFHQLSLLRSVSLCLSGR